MMLRILIIIKDDNLTKIQEQIKSLKIQDFDIYKFKPISYKKDEAINELEELCKKESFDIALVDYYLFWDKLTGDVFINTLKKFKIPFVLSKPLI